MYWNEINEVFKTVSSSLNRSAFFDSNSGALSESSRLNRSCKKLRPTASFAHAQYKSRFPRARRRGVAHAQYKSSFRDDSNGDISFRRKGRLNTATKHGSTAEDHGVQGCFGAAGTHRFPAGEYLYEASQGKHRCNGKHG